MPLKIGNFSFKPSITLSLVGCMLLMLFISLGKWQLNRADEKRAIMQEYAQRSAQPVTELPLPVSNLEHWRSRRVKVTGRFDTEKQFLLDNQVSRGQVGFEVLTPFKPLHEQQAILVDRGWVPLGNDRTQLPQVDVETGVTSLSGTVYVPYKRGFRLGAMDKDVSGWPRLTEYLDFSKMSERLGYPLAAMTLRLDPSLPNGYRREWQPISLLPETHLAYAMQWFTLASVLIVIYLALSLKRTATQNSNND
jgi:surfeit locus 1 family protein